MLAMVPPIQFGKSLFENVKRNFQIHTSDSPQNVKGITSKVQRII